MTKTERDEMWDRLEDNLMKLTLPDQPIPKSVMAMDAVTLVRDLRKACNENESELLLALRAIVFQALQGKVLERDSCITKACAILKAQEESK